MDVLVDPVGGWDMFWGGEFTQINLGKLHWARVREYRITPMKGLRMTAKNCTARKLSRRVFGGGANLYAGIANLEAGFGAIEDEMLRLVEGFAKEFPLRGRAGLFIRIIWIERRGREVPSMLVWRTLMDGMGYERRWGKDVIGRPTKQMIYHAGLYSKRAKVSWYVNEVVRLRRERKKLAASWDRIRKIVLPYLKERDES